MVHHCRTRVRPNHDPNILRCMHIKYNIMFIHIVHGASLEGSQRDMRYHYAHCSKTHRNNVYPPWLRRITNIEIPANSLTVKMMALYTREVYPQYGHGGASLCKRQWTNTHMNSRPRGMLNHCKRQRDTASLSTVGMVHTVGNNR